MSEPLPALAPKDFCPTAPEAERIYRQLSTLHPAGSDCPTDRPCDACAPLVDRLEELAAECETARGCTDGKCTKEGNRGNA